MKFGGGCLRDGRTLAQSCAIIAAQPRVTVVVSAISGVTELLLAAIEQAKRGGKTIPAVMESLAEKHGAILAELELSAVQAKSIQKEIGTQLTQIERLLTGTACHGDLTPAVRARLLSYGERMAARLFAGTRPGCAPRRGLHRRQH
jgi:aspartokinase/homoserine dehydrogenase 1